MANYAEFICAVGSMRIAQKEYFKSRDKKSLYRAWETERTVDNMLTELLAPPSSANELNTPNGSSEQINPTNDDVTDGSTQHAPY